VKLFQNQLYKRGDDFIRIVELERLAVVYKTMKDPIGGEGTTKMVTKKEFCRLIKGAELLDKEAYERIMSLPER
jgi:hypothetical protein